VQVLLVGTSYANDCLDSEKSIKHDHFEIQVLNFLPSKSIGHIIIVPPTGGTNVLDRSYARKLCAEGFSAHILSHWHSR